MTNVTNLKAFKALKNPLLAICQQLENHQKIIGIYNSDIKMLFDSSVKTKLRQKHLVNAVQVLIWSNIISWLTIGGLIIALFCHSHSITSLL